VGVLHAVDPVDLKLPVFVSGSCETRSHVRQYFNEWPLRAQTWGPV